MISKSIAATLNYTADNGRSPNFYFYEPGAGETVDRNPAGTDFRTVEIHNGWPNVDKFDADTHGFELKDFASSFRNFGNPAAVKNEFYADVVKHVERFTGARRVEVFDHTLRQRMPDLNDLSVQTTIERPAVQMVHCDYTPTSGPARVRDLFPDEADQLLSQRVAFFNVWKPLHRTVEELPLAMCDATSNLSDDFIKMELKYSDRDGEIYVMRFSEQHRWIYFPEMPADQAILLKTYDSKEDGRARFVGHTAFEDPNTLPNAAPRESIEVRTIAFF